MNFYARSTAAKSFLELLAKYKKKEFENNLSYFLQNSLLALIKKDVGSLKMNLVLREGWFKLSILSSTLGPVLRKDCQYYFRNFISVQTLLPISLAE